VVSQGMESCGGWRLLSAANFIVVSDGALDVDCRPVLVWRKRSGSPGRRKCSARAYRRDPTWWNCPAICGAHGIANARSWRVAETAHYSRRLPGICFFHRLIPWRGQRQGFRDAYDYNIAPVYDQHPFFIFHAENARGDGTSSRRIGRGMAESYISGFRAVHGLRDQHCRRCSWFLVLATGLCTIEVSISLLLRRRLFYFYGSGTRLHSGWRYSQLFALRSVSAITPLRINRVVFSDALSHAPGVCSRKCAGSKASLSDSATGDCLSDSRLPFHMRLLCRH